jgi:hypothetical protein
MLMATPVTRFEEEGSDPAASTVRWQQPQQVPRTTVQVTGDAALVRVAAMCPVTPVKVSAHAKGDPPGVTRHSFRRGGQIQ